ncbi:hypothetical protein GCM10009646_78970 [Streptomyces aureus]
MSSDDTDRCPECGGELHRGRSTQAYSYLSCVDCEWFDKIKDGSYHDGCDSKDRTLHTGTDR